MNLKDVFSRKPDPDKLVKKIAKHLSDISGYLHLAHTRESWKQNNLRFKEYENQFRELQRRKHSGDDVTQALDDLSVDVKDLNDNLF